MNKKNLKKELEEFFVRRNNKTNFFIVVCTLIYAIVVIYLMTKHEFWRDEVRALSIATESSSLSDLFKNLKNEGHPPLWHMLLHYGYLICHSTLILPIVSLLVAISSVALFVAFAPFTILETLLFVFGVIPLYEYSVMCRNYGISMLLLFLYCVVYKNRFNRPWAAVGILSLLTLTNFHSLIVATAFMGLLLCEAFWLERKKVSSRVKIQLSVGLGVFLVVIAGVVILTYPDSTSKVTGLRSRNLQTIIEALGHFFTHTGRSFVPLFGPTEYIATGTFLLLWIFMANWPRLFMVFLYCLLGFHMFFESVYYGSNRHVGILYIATLCLFWIGRKHLPSPAQNKTAAWLQNYTRWVFPVLFLIFLGYQIRVGVPPVINDIGHQTSSSADFGRFMRMNTALDEAIIIGEPDYLLESLPYYIDNKIYFPRGNKFGKWTNFTTRWRPQMSLGGVLQVAKQVKTDQARPVLLLLSTSIPWNAGNSGEMPVGYGNIFTWNAEESKDLLKSADFVTAFNRGMGDENYYLFIMH